MNPPAVPYRKLPGAAWTLSGRSRLWIADDHLLEANAMFIFERYHRFFLHDIRALLVQRTNVGRVFNIVLGAVGAIATLVAAGFFWAGEKAPEPETRIVLWVFAGMVGAAALVLLGLLLVNLLLGPTCQCVVHTGAGAHPLEAPRRLRRAHRLLAELTPHVEAAQGAAQR